MFTPSLQLKQLTGAQKIQIGHQIEQSSIPHLHKSHGEKWRSQKIAKIKNLHTEAKNNEEPEDNNLQSQLKRLQKQHFTGCVNINVCGQTWKLYLSLGRFAWASGGIHERRRWRRQLIRTGISQQIQIRPGDRFECWDYGLLTLLSQRKLINKEQQIAIVRGVVAEVLLEILQAIELATLSYAATNSNLEKPVDSSIENRDNIFSLIPRLGVRPSHDDTGILPRDWTLETELTLAISTKVWNGWKQSGLVLYSPHLAPIIKNQEKLQEQVSFKTYNHLVNLINGKRTLQDLATLTKKNILSLTKMLLPYIHNKTIGLRKIPDLSLSSPISQKNHEQDKKKKENCQNTQCNRGLVFCVDDNEGIRRSLKTLLTDAGYRVITVGESVKALPALLQYKPEVIFLDLMMPIANGYEICTQIRRIKRFENVPIIFLTGNDGLVDRVRAKMVGATDFLAKPINRDRVLATVGKYIKGKEARPIL